MPELKVGERLKRRYQITKFVAQGGFGEVYQAHDTMLRADVALKVLKGEVRRDPRSRDDFMREAQRQAQLRGHPHVVNVLDIDEVDRDGEPFPYCVLEWLPGGTLHQFVPSGGARPDVDRLRRWMSQTADALDAAAQRSMIHRDVKPGNIFRDERGDAKLADFGLAKMVTRTVAQVSQQIGTLAFMPPEQFRVGGNITPAADVFALGVTIWLMLTGKLPLQYGGQMLDNPSFVMPRLRTLFQGCPPDVDEVVDRMLKSDPALRPSAAEVRDLLVQPLSGSGRVVAPAAAPAVATPSTPAPAKKGLLGGWSLFRSGTAARSAMLNPAQDAIHATERLMETPGLSTEALGAAIPLNMPAADGPSRWSDPQETAPLPEGAILGFGSPRFRHDATVNAVAITPDGRRAVTVSEDKLVHLWELASGGEYFAMPGHTESISAVAVTSDGCRALTAAGDKSLRVWDLETGHEVCCMTGHTDKVMACAVTPNGRLAVSGSADRSVQVWDMVTGRDLFWLGRHAGAVYCVAITPDGRYVVSAGADSTLRVWELETRQELYRIEGSAGIIYSAAVTPDGARVIAANYDMSLGVWELQTGQEVHRMVGHEGPVVSVAVTPDGKRAVSAGQDRTVRVWDLEQGIELASMEGHNGFVTGVGVSRDGRVAASVGDDRTLRLWDLEAYREIRPLVGHTRAVSAVAIARDGRRAVSGSWDRTLRVWNMENAEQLARLEGHTSIVYAAVVLPDNQRALSAAGDGTLRLWMLDSGQEIQKLEGHTAAVRSVAVSADGRRAVSASDDRTLRVWDLNLGEARRIPCAYSVFDVLLTPDAKRAVCVADDKTLRVIDVDSGRERRKMEGHKDSIHGIALASGGRYVVSASADTTIRVWEVESGKERRLLKGHERNVYAVEITPDGRQIVSISDDETLRVWDFETGRQLGMLVCPYLPLCLALSPDGKWVLTGNTNTSLTLYALQGILNGSA